jgi:hypothetical protein
MNTEELKAIIEVIKTLTSDGLTGFIWYLVIDKIVNTLILGGIAVAIIRVIAATCVQVNKPDHPRLSREQVAFEAVRSAWLYGTNGSNSEFFPIYEQLKKYEGEFKP